MTDKKKVRILFVVNRLIPGGAEKMIVASFNSLPRDRYEVWLLTFFPEKEKSFSDRVQDRARWRVIPFTSYFSFRFWHELGVFLRRNEFDIAISTLYFSSFVMRLARIFAPRTKCIVREANVFEGGKSRRQQFMDRILSRITHRYIAVSENVRSSMAAGGIPFQKISVLPNGIAAEWFEAAPAGRREAMRQDLGIPLHAKVFITVGELRSPKKGIPDLLAAMALVFKKHPDAYLLLVGEGQFPVAPEHGRRILFLGNKTRTGEVRELLSLADVFVLPSLWEGFPNVLLEAMASGLPSVCTAVGGVPEILTEDTGFLVRPGDTEALAENMSRLLANDALRGRMGAAAQNRARGFSWEAYIEGLERVIAGVSDLA